MNIEENILFQTKCLFCHETNDRVLYPACLFEDSFSSYTFSARRKRKIEHYQIVQCKNCSLVRSNLILSEKSLNQFYSESQFTFPEEAPFAAKTYISLLKKLINRYRIRTNYLLEVGCSNGFFLEAALKEHFNHVLGFEPSKNCYQHTPDHIKPHIINEAFRSELSGNRQFDIICSFHVFDHLNDPLSTLKSLAENLNSAGHILIVCHNVNSWSAKLFGNRSPIFDVEHIYLFSKKTISMLLEKAGFKVLEAGSLANTYPLSYWIHMLPSGDAVLKKMAAFIKKVPVRIHAGNLYILGEKTTKA